MRACPLHPVRVFLLLAEGLAAGVLGRAAVAFISPGDPGKPETDGQTAQKRDVAKPTDGLARTRMFRS